MTMRAATLLIAGMLWAYGCASGGPGVQGTEAASLFQSYSGRWLLDEAGSGDVAVPDQSTAGPARGGGGGRAGGRGGRGGGVGGGGRGGGGAGIPGSGTGAGAAGLFNAGAVRAATALARARPASIQLDLSDSLFVAEYEGGGRTAVPMSGEEVGLELGGAPARVNVEWQDGRPSLRWVIEDAGRVTDSYEVLPSGRMLLTRVFRVGISGDVEARFFFNRPRATGGSR